MISVSQRQMIFNAGRDCVSITSQGNVDGGQFQNVHDLQVAMLRDPALQELEDRLERH